MLVYGSDLPYNAGMLAKTMFVFFRSVGLDIYIVNIS